MKYLIAIFILSYFITSLFGFRIGVEFMAAGMFTWGLTTNYWKTKYEKQSV